MYPTRPPAPQHRPARRALHRGATVVVTLAAVTLPSTSAWAQTDARSLRLERPHVATAAPHGTSGGSASQKPAVVGPMLDFFRFGAVVGLPLACQAGTSALGSGAAYLGQAEAVAPVISQVNSGCDTASEQGAAFVDQGQSMATPLNAINPYANQGIEMGANAAEQYGEQYGETLAPLGPTIVGSGATLRWFEGR